MNREAAKEKKKQRNFMCKYVKGTYAICYHIFHGFYCNHYFHLIFTRSDVISLTHRMERSEKRCLYIWIENNIY